MIEKLTFFAGFLTLAALAALAFGVAWWLIAASIRRLRERRDELIESAKAQQLGSALIDASWWFDDVATRLAIRLIGDSLAHRGSFDINGVREQWMRDRAAALGNTKEQANG